MAEKGELPSDQVSLPPTYAPSETYTESPPPAYKRSGMAAVKVAKIICFTVLVMTFLIGFAVIAYKWIQLRECNCPMKQEKIAQSLPLVAGSLGLNNLIESIEEPIIKKTINEMNKTPKKDIFLDSDQELKEMKKLRLPIDMLLGNPSLMGKDMPCNVQKRKQKIADGIFTESVIVTCENEDKMDLPFFPIPKSNQMNPPLSLLSHIIKALASKPKNENENKDLDAMMSGHSNVPFPFENPIPFPIRQEGPPRILPFGPGMMHIMPIKKFEMNRPPPHDEMKKLPMPFSRPMPHPFIKRINLRPIHINDNEIRHTHPEPVIRPIAKFNIHPNSEQIMNPLGGAPIRIIRIHPNEEEENNEFPQRLPFPFPLNSFSKLFPMRKARVLRVMPKPIADHEALPDYPEQEEIFNQFHNPIEIIDHDEEKVEENVPEASGRSLPSPRVALPGIRFFRLPNQPPFLRLPESRAITHMEMQQSEDHQPKPEFFPPSVLQAEGEDFGPPKTHTVLHSPPEPIFRSEHPAIFQPQLENHEEIDGPHIPESFVPQSEPISLSQLQPRFFAPPPPRFAREGRSNPFAEINPEAELFGGPNQDAPNNHHLILN